MVTSTSCLESELLTLSALDGRNCNNLIYEILKKFYIYNKYLLDNDNQVDDEIIHILSLIENDADNFFDDYEINIELQSKIFISYYEYVSNYIIDKEKINLYYKENCKGISKIFNKKNKNS